MADWPTLALYWNQAPSRRGGRVDPIFGRPLAFYLFTLPAWQLIAGWLLTLAIIVVHRGGRSSWSSPAACGCCPAAVAGAASAPARPVGRRAALVLLMLAVRVYLGRFERLFEDHTIFTGVTYTDAHVRSPACSSSRSRSLLGAAIALVNAVAGAAAALAGRSPSRRRSSATSSSARRLVRQQLHRQAERTGARAALHRAQHRDDAAGVRPGPHRAACRFPPTPASTRSTPANNQATLQNIRLWDWRALQDTLRQIQEIRTYYDFPDIDIDRYTIDGAVRQMMLAARELNVEKLPESSRNWINEKLIYTHGYGVTMNPVNGFTPEGLPDADPEQHARAEHIPSLTVTRPEIYFGELTDTDVYVKTRQKEFNYPQGETNNLTSYEGTGGIVLGGFFRRLLDRARPRRHREAAVQRRHDAPTAGC